MTRFPTNLHIPSKNPYGNLNSLSTKQQCLSLLNLCSSMKQLHQIHAQIQTSGLHHDRFLMSEILRFCALSPAGNLNYARSLLDHDPNPITFSWNMLIRAYASNNLSNEAVGLFVRMRRNGTRPNKLTFPFLLKACSRLSDLRVGKQIQVDVLKNGVDSDVYVQNTLIHYHGSCREIRDARRVFESMSFRTLVSWNAILTACVENLQSDESIKVFSQMIDCGFEPDETTMVVLLSACTELGNLSLGRWIHCYVVQRGMVMNVQLGTALVDMYAKCGAIDCARQVFERLPKKNVWTWSAMILGLAQHGFAKEALGFFLLMKNCLVEPNYVTFLGVLCAFSHAGLVDDGYRFFNEMVHVHRIEPMMMHYGAMVDILGRRGRLQEAYDFIMSMPVEADAIVWRTLLSACGIHDVSDSSGVGGKVRKRLLELEPKRSGNYVMVANMYAEVGLWEEAANVRRVMSEGGMKKMAAESCVEVGGLIHRFLSGDDSRVEYEVIYQLLDGLNLHMKMCGFA